MLVTHLTSFFCDLNSDLNAAACDLNPDPFLTCLTRSLSCALSVESAAVEISDTSCDASSVAARDVMCDNAIDALPGTDWASKGDGIGGWIKVRADTGSRSGRILREGQGEYCVKVNVDTGSRSWRILSEGQGEYWVKVRVHLWSRSG